METMLQGAAPQAAPADLIKDSDQTKFAKDERGANLVEYILLVALIALAVIAAVIFLRGQVSDKFNETGSKLSSGRSPTRSRLTVTAFTS